MATATDFKDYYATLGVSKTATPEEIKLAYRKIARKCHPDLNPGDKAAEEKFKNLNEANEVLSDPEKREKYDQFGQQWNQPRSTENSSYRGTNVSNEDLGQYGDFESFINDLLGRRSGTQTDRSTPGGFEDFGGGYRAQAPSPDSEAALA
jgi:curved DNA-binding protein